MRCYFDVLTQVHVDTTGVEADFDHAMAETRKAIAEVLANQEEHGVLFRNGLFLLVRTESNEMMGVIPLFDAPETFSDS